ncbi:hypothetical protein ABPG74_020742 [Tetrahymena malaccensis]
MESSIKYIYKPLKFIYTKKLFRYFNYKQISSKNNNNKKQIKMNKQFLCLLLLALFCLSAAQNLRNLQSDQNGDKTETDPEPQVCNPYTGECCFVSDPTCSCWIYVYIGNQLVSFYVCE